MARQAEHPGMDVPLTEFVGRVIAAIHRLNDVADKLVIVPGDMFFSKEQIVELI